MQHIITCYVNWFIRLEGRKRYYTAGILGALATLALPPIYLIPLLFVSFPSLLWLIYSSKSKKQACLTGWWFSFGHFVFGIYWIAFSVLTEADKFWWLVPFAIFGLSGLLGLYGAAAALAAYVIPGRLLHKAMAFAIVWAAGEMLRGYFLMFVTLYGFPWNLTGYIWTVSDAMIQTASVTGIYGLSFLTVLIAAIPAALVNIKSNNTIGYKEDWKPVVAILSLLPLLWVAGTIRLSKAELTTVPNIKLRLVQSNILENHHWEMDKRIAVLRRNIELSMRPGYEQTTHIIWSESSLPFVTEAGSPWLAAVAKVVPPSGFVITGAMRMDGTEGSPQLFSTLNAIDTNGNVVGSYDKYRLVPFGEYIPWRNILPLDTIVGGTDFMVGKGPTTLSLPGLPPVSPLICYDAIFPQSVIDHKNRPKWLLNITNDAWFEKRLELGSQHFQFSTGPYQHFNMVRIRSVEQGLPLIRVANTGITASIDPYGRIVSRLKLGETGILDTELYNPLLQPSTYSRFSDSIVLIILCICGLFAVNNKEKANI